MLRHSHPETRIIRLASFAAIVLAGCLIGSTAFTQSPNPTAQPPNPTTQPPRPTTQPPDPKPAPTLPPGAPAEEGQTFRSTPLKGSPAAKVNFRQQLGLPFPSLNTLGSRIDAARRVGDPVTLANAASELWGAEKVSGKLATLNSSQVLAEAADLASLREKEAELKAVLHVADRVALAEEKVADLKRQIAIKRMQIRDVENKEEPRNAARTVLVKNYTNQYIDIQINGELQGQIQPSGRRLFVVDELRNPVILKGWGDADEVTFGPVVLKGRFSTYTWNINADDAFPNPNVAPPDVRRGRPEP